MRNAAKIRFCGLILVNSILFLSGCVTADQAVVKPKLHVMQRAQNVTKFSNQAITTSGTGLGEAMVLYNKAYGDPTPFTEDGKILKYQPKNGDFYYTAFFIQGLAAQISINYNHAVSSKQAMKDAERLLPKDAVEMKRYKKIAEQIVVYNSESLVPRFENISRNQFINNINNIEPGVFSMDLNYNDRQLVDSIVIEVGEE